MANQFTTGKREGHDQATKDKTRAELLMNRLEKCASGEVELTSVQVAAAKVVLDKVKPSLQAVSQSQEDPWAEKSEEELLEQVKALITSRPELLAGVKHLLEPVRQVGSEPESVVGEQQRAA